MSSEFPRTIAFEDIRIGDTIESTSNFQDVICKFRGVVHSRENKVLYSKDHVTLGTFYAHTFVLLDRNEHTLDKLGVGSVIAITTPETVLVLFKNPDGWRETSRHQARDGIFASINTRIEWLKAEWDSQFTTSTIIFEA